MQTNKTNFPSEFELIYFTKFSMSVRCWQICANEIPSSPPIAKPQELTPIRQHAIVPKVRYRNSLAQARDDPNLGHSGPTLSKVAHPHENLLLGYVKNLWSDQHSATIFPPVGENSLSDSVRRDKVSRSLSQVAKFISIHTVPIFNKFLLDILIL